jgi:hypothetical protein
MHYFELVVLHRFYAGFEIFTAVKIHIVFFCVMVSCNLVDKYNVVKEPTVSILYLKDGGSMFLRKVGIHLQEYKMS